MNNQESFIRQNGVFGGVCGGLSKHLDIPVLLLRVALAISFFVTFGLTFLIYLSAVFAFPSEQTAAFGKGPKFLGVCHNLSPKLNIPEEWLRFFTLLAWIGTGFLPVFVIYVVLFLFTAKNVTTAGGGASGSSDIRDVN